MALESLLNSDKRIRPTQLNLFDEIISKFSMIVIEIWIRIPQIPQHQLHLRHHQRRCQYFKRRRQ